MPGTVLERCSLLDEETLLRLAGEGKDIPLPSELIFEPTGRCNMRCRMCFYSADHFAPEHEMDFDGIVACLGKLPRTIRRATLIGGEPLFHPRIVDIVRLFAERDVSVGISTNGYFLTPELTEKFAALGNVDKVAVSIDGLEEVHNKARGPNNAFQRTFENLNHAARHFPVQVVSVCHNGNERDIIDLVPSLKGTKNLTFSVEIAREYPNEVLERTAGRYGVEIEDLHMKKEGGMGPTVGADEMAPLLKEIRSKTLREGVPFHFIPTNTLNLLPGLLGRVSEEKDLSLVCRRLLKARLDSRGNLIHCYALRMPMGSLLEESFEDIWNSEAYKAFRRDLIGRGLAPICGYCFAAQPSKLAKAMAKSPSPVRLGIAGCGKIASVYVRVLKDMPEFELVGVSSRSTDRGMRFADDHDTRAFPMPELVKTVEAVVLATEPDSHWPMIKEIAAHGDVHILIEKPLGASLDDSRRILELRKDHPGLIWGMSSQMRFSPLMASIREMMDDRRIGALCSFDIRCSYSRMEGYYAEGNGWRRRVGGNVIFNQGVHMLDFILDTFGLPDSVEGDGSRERHGDVPFDTATIRLSYADGLEGTLTVTVAGPPGGPHTRFLAIGCDGEISVESDASGRLVKSRKTIGGSPFVASDNRPFWKRVVRKGIEAFGSEDMKMKYLRGNPTSIHDLGPQLRAFAKSVRGEALYPASLEDGDMVVAMATAAQVSIVEKRRVILREILDTRMQNSP